MYIPNFETCIPNFGIRIPNYAMQKAIQRNKKFSAPDFGDASPCSHVRQLANSGNFGYARQ